MRSRYYESVNRLFDVQKKIVDIHPFLERVFPVAVAEDDQFMIYNVNPSIGHYRLVKRSAIPMPIPPGIRAAFPLESYGGRIACVVTGEVFDSLDGQVTIFHEFIHCHQFETCEQELKNSLEVFRQAQAVNDFMWEINYPFPYGDSQIANLYASFMQAVDEKLRDEALALRKLLKSKLKLADYEYMIWQEWKEGFAQFIENRIRSRLGLTVNQNGRTGSFSRVSFYAGGEGLVEILAADEPTLPENIEKLFHRMKLAHL